MTDPSPPLPLTAPELTAPEGWRERAGELSSAVRRWLGWAETPGTGDPETGEEVSVPEEPPEPVLVLGGGGVGKSTFARFCAGGGDAPAEYLESYGLERVTLPAREGKPEVELVVPPGQPRRRNEDWPDLSEAVARGDYRGVVLVNCHGLHSLREDNFRSHPDYRGGMPAEEFLAAYAAARRDEEVAIARALAEDAARCPNPV